MTRVTTHEVAERMSELLEKVRSQKEYVSITHDGVEVARLLPPLDTSITVGELVAKLQALSPVDETFADDLEDINRQQGSLPDDPWES